MKKLMTKKVNESIISIVKENSEYIVTTSGKIGNFAETFNTMAESLYCFQNKCSDAKPERVITLSQLLRTADAVSHETLYVYRKITESSAQLSENRIAIAEIICGVSLEELEMKGV